VSLPHPLLTRKHALSTLLLLLLPASAAARARLTQWSKGEYAGATNTVRRRGNNSSFSAVAE
jgi:hypothetical protein